MNVPFTHNRPKLVVIDAALAEKYLEIHRKVETEETKNRQINSRNVEKIAQDMLDGTYTKTYSPIIFGKNGINVDGQHRLEAIVLTGLAFEQLVVHDDYFESAHCFKGDTPLARSASFIENIKKIGEAQAKIVMRLGAGENNPTSARVKQVWDAIEPEFDRAVGPISNRRCITKASVLIGAVAVALSTGEYDYVREQLHAMARDKDEDMAPQVRKLHRLLIERFAKDNDKLLIAAYTFACLQKSRKSSTSLPKNGTIDASREEFLTSIRTFL